MAYSPIKHTEYGHGMQNSGKAAPKLAFYQHKARPNNAHKYGNKSLQKYGKRGELQSK